MIEENIEKEQEVVSNSEEEEILFIDEGEKKEVVSFEETKEEKEALRQLALGKVKFSIKLKLGLSLAFLLVVTLLTLSVWLLNEEVKNLLSEMEFRSKVLSSGLVANLKEGFDDVMTRHTIVKETAEQVKDLLKIRIYDTSMNFIDSSDASEFNLIINRFGRKEQEPEKASKEISSILMNLKEQRIIESKDRIKFTIFQPVFYEKTIIGYAVIDFTKELILKKIATLRNRSFIFIGIAIVLGLLGFYLLISVILSPIKRLILGIRQLAEKPIYNVHPIRLNTQDEFEQVSAEFNDMIKRLKEAEEEKEKKKKLEQEIQIGQDLQKNLLPETWPKSPCFEFDSYYQPKSGMGGDYYDILELSEDSVGVIIADVCGKGIPAAIIMVIIRTIFRSVARFVSFPSQALDIINKNIAGRTAGEKYATMFYYIFNIKTGTLTYSNAAHTALLVYHKKTGEVKRYGEEDPPEELKKYEFVGAPVGVREETVYFDKTVQLEEGDIIVLSTDGITEAMNPEHKLYDEKALMKDIVRFENLSASEIKDSVIKEIENFTQGEPPNDDRTLLIFKVLKIGQEYSLEVKEKIPQIKTTIESLRKVPVIEKEEEKLEKRLDSNVQPSIIQRTIPQPSLIKQRPKEE